jgi:hypothetical protein
MKKQTVVYSCNRMGYPAATKMNKLGIHTTTKMKLNGRRL